MNIALFLIGGLLIFLGFNKKSTSSQKKLKEMSGGDLVNTGIHSYLKIMMIAVWVVLILIGFIVSTIF